MDHPLYTLLYAAVLPGARLRQWWRGRREPGYRVDAAARFGHGPALPPGAVWIHAVSAGEVIAAEPLIRGLRERRSARPVLLTVTTATGRAQAERLAAIDEGLTVTWLPWDLPGPLDRFLRRARPALLVVMETELWPNLLARCDAAGVPVILANARLSERSARGYGRVAALARRMLGRLAHVAAQDEATATRLRDLGLAPERLVVTGSIKFDATPPDDLAARVAAARARLGAEGRALVVAASTHDDEERRVLRAFADALRARSELRLVIVPRHPERCDALWEALRAGPFPAARWSAGPASDRARVVLVDVMGELPGIYGAADVAFVGGSLVPRGGHNPIEAALQGVPVLTGPHVFNFEAVVSAFAEVGALIRVEDEDALARETLALLDDDGERARRGREGRAVVAAGRGALTELTALIEARLPPDAPD